MVLTASDSDVYARRRPRISLVSTALSGKYFVVRRSIQLSYGREAYRLLQEFSASRWVDGDAQPSPAKKSMTRPVISSVAARS
jgi:hypothetical protein